MKSQKVNRKEAVICLRRDSVPPGFVELAHRGLEKQYPDLPIGYTQRAFVTPVDYIRMTAPCSAAGIESLELVFGDPT